MLRRGLLPTNGLAVLLLALFACGFGSLLFGKLMTFSPAGQERVRVETTQWEEQQQAERPAKVFWAWAQRVTLAIALALGTLAVVTVVGLYGVRRAVTIYPDRRGMLPLLLGRIAGTWMVYDPNRSPTAVMSLGEGSPLVTHHLPVGMEDQQAQITSQAQAVQALAAVASGQSNGDKASEMAAGVIGVPRPLAKPLPEVRRSPWESSHVERLLIEAGELEAAEYE